MRGTETIKIFRGAKVDSLDSVDAGDEVAHHEEPHCIVWPRTSEELGKGTVIIEGENVFTPPGADVLATDQVELRGVRYDVEGKPGDYRMRGRQRGLLVVLKRLGS